MRSWHGKNWVRIAALVPDDQSNVGIDGMMPWIPASNEDLVYRLLDTRGRQQAKVYAVGMLGSGLGFNYLWSQVE
jgi:hypothetical protein